MRLRSTLGSAALAGILAIGGMLSGAPAAQAGPSEDSPDWDCRTMGNRICDTEIRGTHYWLVFDEAGNPLRLEVSPYQ